jgi:hypothetical protein
MHFPSKLTVQLTSVDPVASNIADILVAIDIRVGGQYYYGTVVGLSDALGRVEITRRQLDDQFTNDQRLFPMDYKIALAHCDDVIGVRILGGAEFRDAQRAARLNAHMDPDIRLLWNRAQNRGLRTVTIDLELGTATREDKCVTVPIVAA